MSPFHYLIFTAPVTALYVVVLFLRHGQGYPVTIYDLIYLGFLTLLVAMQIARKVRARKEKH
ncbi:hypothetical protein B7H19_09335 [Pseudomonas putida]|uniref:hypothetical protein n=1 Tax=Pseudomonas putida TaxID=303 RepID=UPI000A114969|nr:hypothetical protein [Pseudomonas putida]ORL69686.1 hypothetical protein B7H19_09335 [Pseudomonas putida]